MNEDNNYNLTEFLETIETIRKVCKERGIDKLKELHGIPPEEDVPLDNQDTPILDKRIQNIENPRMRTLLNQRAWRGEDPFEPLEGWDAEFKRLDNLIESERTNGKQTQDSQGTQEENSL